MQVGQQHATTSNGTRRSLLGRCMAGKKVFFFSLTDFYLLAIERVPVKWFIE
jgi:hypothetical protein